jgi:hypothetical protein
MIFGPLSPLLLLLLLSFQYYLTSLFLFLFLAYPFFFPLRESPLLARFFLCAGSWFKAVGLHMEEDVIDVIEEGKGEGEGEGEREREGEGEGEREREREGEVDGAEIFYNMKPRGPG